MSTAAMVSDPHRPERRYMVVGGRVIDIGSHWRRRKDGAVVEVVWMGDWRGPRVQVRRAGASNMKNTHWIDPENLVRRYDAWTVAHKARLVMAAFWTEETDGDLVVDAVADVIDGLAVTGHGGVTLLTDPPDHELRKMLLSIEGLEGAASEPCTPDLAAVGEVNER